MKIDAEKLAELIKGSMDNVYMGYESERFAIISNGEIEVQVNITQNPDDFIGAAQENHWRGYRYGFALLVLDWFRCGEVVPDEHGRDRQ